MRDTIRIAISKALEELGFSEVEFVVEHPSDIAHGDYATNACLVGAKSIGKNPRDLAEELKSKLDGKIEDVEKIEIAGPGFINFFLSREFFVRQVREIHTNPDSWGRNDSWKNKKVIVEYTDPNPFKEFHVGHLFTNVVGESIARLFMMAGAHTMRVNYQGDVGLHVAHALWGMQALGLTKESKLSARELGKAYALGSTKYKESDEVKAETISINKAIYARSDAKLNELYDAGRAVSLEYFETIYAMVGTTFDAYFFESEAGPRGKELVLAHPEVFTVSENARVFNGEQYGLHTRVFLNSEGLPTYEAKELALAKLKEERLGVYDHSVISTSNEITEYFKVLTKAMSFVYPELAAKTEHIGHGTVRLSEGKMSSRTGQVIAAVDFISEIQEAASEKMKETGHDPDNEALAEEIAIGAIKYATLKGNILQNSVFSKEEALSFEGNSGPYLMYTHARITSVETRAEEKGIRASVEAVPERPYETERILYRFPEVVQDALIAREPHQLVTFLTELAASFNTFYAHEKIADEDDSYASYKLALALAVKTTLKNGLWVLGIEAPERM